MKKITMLALAILLSLAFAVPVSAQSRRSYYGDSYAGSALERSTRQTMGLVDGLFGEIGYGSRGRNSYGRSGGYDQYRYEGRYRGRYYGRGISRNEVLGTAAVVGGALLINKLAHRGDGKESESEEPSKCYERVVKASRKQHVELDGATAMAFCSGQSLETSEQAPEARKERASEPPSPVRPVHAPGAFIQGDRICNNFHQPLTVLVDGREILVVAPGGSALLSRLPQGHLTSRY